MELEGGSRGGSILISMPTALEPKAFRDGMRERIRWKGASRDPNEVVKIVNKVNDIYVQFDVVEALSETVVGRGKQKQANREKRAVGSRHRRLHNQTRGVVSKHLLADGGNQCGGARMRV